MLFPNVEYTTNYIGHVKDCTKNLPDEITQYMSDTDQEEIIDTLNRAVRKVFLQVHLALRAELAQMAILNGKHPRVLH